MALLAVSLQMLSPSLLPSAQAGSTTLCSGFSDCSRKGMGAAGYKDVWHKMFWLMFPYRNCVNYVAYRVIEDGGPKSRPWTGSGNATNWGVAMKRITDQTPSVGSVAWWKAYAPGAGRYGHVAYVEKVVSADEIIISESNYGSDFSWRRITKGRGWPSGFIHFTDTTKQIRNTAVPAITGTPRVGGRLTVAGGKWEPVSKATIRWYADGVAIAGATGRSFTVTSAQNGKRLTATVTGSKAGWTSASVTTKPTAPVGQAQIDFREPPVITGTPEVGSPLTVTPGVFFPRGGQRTFQWYADGKAVPGATGTTFTPTRAQLRTYLTVRQRVAIPGYATVEKESAKVGIVMAPPVAVSNPGGLVGSMLVGQTLSADPGRGPAGAYPQYTWRRDDAVISGATKRTYTLTAADVGHKVAVTVRWKQKRYRNTDFVFGGDLVKAPATLSLQTKSPKPGRGVAMVRVTAPGTAPTGSVTVRIGRFTKTETVQPGRWVWIGFDGMTAGRKAVRVSYSGSSVVTPTSGSGSVSVRGGS